MVVTPAALEYYQETFRQLAFEYAECWFLCCKAEDACGSEHWPRIRRMTMAANGGAVVPGSEVAVAAADDRGFFFKKRRRCRGAWSARSRSSGGRAPRASIRERCGGDAPAPRRRRCAARMEIAASEKKKGRKKA